MPINRRMEKQIMLYPLQWKPLSNEKGLTTATCNNMNLTEKEAKRLYEVQNGQNASVRKAGRIKRYLKEGEGASSGKRHDGILWGSGKVLCFDVSGSYPGIYEG